jgi:hypothetical protein
MRNRLPISGLTALPAFACSAVLALSCGAGDNSNNALGDATGGSGLAGAPVGSATGGAVAGVPGSTGGASLGSGGTVGAGGTVVGTGGMVVGTGGTVVGTGGAVVGSGGMVVGTGGTVGAGGTVVGTGGTVVGTGGTDVGAGGTDVGTGGTDVGAGGTVVGTGGTDVGTGGTGTGGEGTGGEGTGGAPLGECDPYVWPGYDPDLDWTFDATNIDPSTFTVYQGCDASLVAGTMTSGWWSFIWGHDRNPQITDAHIQQVLDGLNEDLGYIRDAMGWPPDDLAQDGYYSSVYLYGSGLCTDNASNTEQGGWQSNIGPYPMVLLSWAPVVDYDRGGITHEAIHAMVHGTPGGDNKAHWFNEGGNTWIQQQLYARRDGSYGVGFLDGAPFVAPHMPIECYSGWLLDGSFGGPDAEGVTDCSWRRYLGGTQYNSIFSHFLALYLSEGSNAWIWQQAQPRNIVETLSTGLGDEQTRHLIMEYRARQALVDFGIWRDTIINQGVNREWGSTLNRECGSGSNPPDYLAVAYAPTTTNGSTIVPDDYTLPGWSGANQIPLNVSGNQVRLNFNPTGANMRMQLAYWAEDGTAVYSQPVESGELCLRLDKAPRNGVVIAVVSNTDYVLTGDAMRFEKYGYTVDMVEGVSSTADRTTRWFLND